MVEQGGWQRLTIESPRIHFPTIQAAYGYLVVGCVYLEEVATCLVLYLEGGSGVSSTL